MNHSAMTALTLTLAAIPASLLLAQSAVPTDRIIALAERGERQTLAEEVRSLPDEAQMALQELLRASVHAPMSSDRLDPMTAAEMLARVYAEVWTDEFLLREVGRFQSWTAAERETKLRADSLRRAGRDAYWRSGIEAGLALWRRSLDASTSIGDSSGVGRALGNIGAAHYSGGQLDSASVFFRRSYDIAVSEGDFLTAANALTNLASVSVDRDDLRGAAGLYRRAALMHEQIGDQRGFAADLNNQALIARRLGDFDTAVERFKRALDINRGRGYLEGEGTNLLGLADVALATGAPDRAASLLREAERAFRAAEDAAGLAATGHRMGILALQRGDLHAASRALAAAADLYLELGWVVEASDALKDAATAHAAIGEFDVASAQLRRAEQLFESIPNFLLVEAGLALASGDLAIRFNEAEEARRSYSRAEALYSQAGYEIGRAEALQGEGHVQLLARAYDKAIPLLEGSLEIQEELGVRRSADLTRVLLGYAEGLAGDVIAAQSLLYQTLEESEVRGDLAGRLVALIALGDLALRSGDANEAEVYYRRGLDLSASVTQPALEWRLQAGLGSAQARRGDLAGSAASLRSAVDAIESTASSISLDDRQSGFLADKWEVYFQLAQVEFRLGHVAQAFSTSERLRARRMLAMLDRGRVGSMPGPDSSLIAREQDLRRYLARVGSQIEGLASAADAAHGLRGTAAETVDPVLRGLLGSAEAEYAILLPELHERVPEYADLVGTSVISWHDVAAVSDPQTAFIEYLVGDSTTIAFTITSDTIAAFDLGLPRRQLSVLVDFARGSMSQVIDERESTDWRAPLASLWQKLFAPIEASGMLEGKSAIRISPNAELHYLPFAALWNQPEGEFLIERFTVTYVPSASVWDRLATRKHAPTTGRILIMAPLPERLPASRLEASEIKRLMGEGSTLLRGTDATENALRSLLGSYDILHLATVGVLNTTNPLFSYLQLARAGSDDGRLEVHEVFGLDLNASLVVLSACETGLGSGNLADVPAGDDWVSFVRTFLFAGADEVLATLWRVEDAATSEFMAEFYGQLRGGISPEKSLALTQRHYVAQPTTSHPLYWAGFVISGS